MRIILLKIQNYLQSSHFRAMTGKLSVFCHCHLRPVGFHPHRQVVKTRRPQTELTDPNNIKIIKTMQMRVMLNFFLNLPSRLLFRNGIASIVLNLMVSLIRTEGACLVQNVNRILRKRRLTCRKLSKKLLPVQQKQKRRVQLLQSAALKPSSHAYQRWNQVSKVLPQQFPFWIRSLIG